MKNLPINEILPQLKENLNNHSTVILQAPPGAGKSTVTPISLLNESWLGDKMIIMLEPRRVAARMVASQMAKFLGEEVGNRVGYQIKMESCKSAQTKILVVTEAILVRKLQSDQSLEDVALIIFDEFHERSIHTDLSLALSLQSQELLRDDLKIMIMSATLNSREISDLLGTVPVVTSQGRTYEIKNVYLEANIKQPDYKTMNSRVVATVLSAIQEDEGDILVFLAGVKEIKTLHTSLLEKLKNSDVLILPLYSALSKSEQDKALGWANKRKIILSTNIAQTSLTIEGVRVVIDTGLEKLSRYNYSNAMNHLELNFISSDSATQRAGRSGRLSNGKCYKLWHKSKILQGSTKPEILRTDLSSLMLDLALWGVEDFRELKWLDIPDAKIIEETKVILKELQMLDNAFMITPFGRDALSLGVHPRFSFMILKANDLGYAYEACLMAALLSQKDIFRNMYSNCDINERMAHLFEKDLNNSFINQYAAKEVIKEAESFYKRLKSIKKVTKKNYKLNQEMMGVLLLFAYPDRLAKQRGKKDNRYKLSNGKGAVLHIEDALFGNEYLVVPMLNAHQKDSYINFASSIGLSQIEEYFPQLINKKESISYNKENKKFDIREKGCFLDLELYSKPSVQPTAKNFRKLLLELIKQEGLELLRWSDKTVNLKNRVLFIKEQKEVNENFDLNVEFEDFSDEGLLNSLDRWLEPYLENIKTIKDLESLDLYSILLSLVPWENQQLLEKLAPLSIKVPSGSNIQIDYSNKQIPILAVRLQEMFGLEETPKILNALVPLQIHLLSPARRPIQITYDLKSFWENSYAEVRKELRGQYKRHYWPDNPYEAVATSKTKKHMMKNI